MDRRQFLATLAVASAGIPGLAQAGAGTEVTPEQVLQALADGETVFIDIFAEWCSTCARQERVITGILQENPSYANTVSFLSVNWDRHRSSAFFDQLNVPRRSTLLVLKGDDELGRIVAGTSRSTIKQLMDTAVSVASDS